MNELALFAGEETMTKPQYIYGTPRACQVCGTVFTPRDADRDNYKPRYCSYACNNKSRQKHHERACGSCGRFFKPRREEQRTCSKACGQNLRAKENPTSEMTLTKQRMAAFCCSLIHRCRRSKSDSTKEILGYGTEDLLRHLEAHFERGMSWGNYGKGRDCWSIDHVRPISTFPPETSVKEINALSNLRPMWHSDNCRKRDKWESR